MDNLLDAPLVGGNQAFRLTYTFTLGGQLKSYTDPWGKQIDYAHDKTGRLDAVTGTSFGGVTSYANNPAYRAWGGLKHLEYGNGFKADVTYDNRLQAATYVLDNPTDSNPATFSKTYDYYADGKLKLADETVSTAANKYDRSFAYDFAGRVKDAKSGSEAKGTEETDLTKLPYRQTYSYNALGNTTGRDSTLWNITTDWGFSYTFSNNRAAGATYDNDGRQTGVGEDINFLYDGAGRMSKTWRDLRYETLLYQDGLGNEGKRSQRIWTVPDDPSSSWGAWQTRYFIFSSVLGRNVTEADTTGKKRRTYVIAAGATIARQGIDEGTTTERVGWEHRDPSGLSARTTFPSGGSGGNEVLVNEELDGLGNNVGLVAPLNAPAINKMSGSDSIPFTDINSGAREVDGILMPGSMVQMLAEGGALRQTTGLLDPYGFPIYRPLDLRLGLGRVGVLQGDPFNWDRGNDRNAQERTAWVSFGGQQTQVGGERSLTDDELTGLRSNVEKLMADKTCSDFINAVVANLENTFTVPWANGKGETEFDKFKGNILENFDRVKKDLGYWVGPLKEGYGAVTNLRGITFSENHYKPNDNSPVSRYLPMRFNGGKRLEHSKKLETTFTLVHELIHAYYLPNSSGTHGGFPTTLHDSMVRAAQEAFVQAGLSKEPVPIYGSDSTYFDDALAVACGKVKL